METGEHIRHRGVDMADAFPYALCVEGQWDPKTPKIKNKLTIYFQSRKSDGGEDCVVDSDDTDGRRATVRFREEEGKVTKLNSGV